MVALLEGSPISTEELCQSPSGSWSLPSRFALFGRAASSRKSRWFQTSILRMMEATVFMGLSTLQTFCGTLRQICASTQSCLGALRTIPITSLLGFCSDIHCQLWDLYIDGCVPFQIKSNQLNLPQVDTNQVVETSQG